jgi:hypothetical protein
VLFALSLAAVFGDKESVDVLAVERVVACGVYVSRLGPSTQPSLPGGNIILKFINTDFVALMTVVIGFNWPVIHDQTVGVIVDGELVYAS